MGFYLHQTGPAASPVPFTFEDANWALFPFWTYSIAAMLERFVIQYSRYQIEKTKPDSSSVDPVAWAAYRADADWCRRSTILGIFGAFTDIWRGVVMGSDEGFAEYLYLGVRHSDPRWTRDHVRRLMENPENYNDIHAIAEELNYPKPKPPGEEATNPEDQTETNRSTGEKSSPTLFTNTGSPWGQATTSDGLELLKSTCMDQPKP